MFKNSDCTRIMCFVNDRNTNEILHYCLVPGVLDHMTKSANPSGHGIKWSCNFCGFTSKQISNVKRHVILRHSKKERLPCPGCDKVFDNKQRFNGHLADAHYDLYNTHKYSITNSLFVFSPWSSKMEISFWVLSMISKFGSDAYFCCKLMSKCYRGSLFGCFKSTRSLKTSVS